MTTIQQVREDLRQFREENSKKQSDIIVQLREMNGTQKDHSIALAKLATVQALNCTRLDKADRERSTMWKLLRALDRAGARQAAYVAGAIAVVMAAMQFLVLPIIKHLMDGG